MHILFTISKVDGNSQNDKHCSAAPTPQHCVVMWYMEWQALLCCSNSPTLCCHVVHGMTSIALLLQLPNTVLSCGAWNIDWSPLWVFLVTLQLVTSLFYQKLISLLYVELTWALTVTPCQGTVGGWHTETMVNLNLKTQIQKHTCYLVMLATRPEAWC